MNKYFPPNPLRNLTNDQLANMVDASTQEQAEGIYPNRQLSCGCCTNGCVCHNHMDIPRGLRPQRCPLHSSTGKTEFINA
jgi:hypothetical protein